MHTKLFSTMALGLSFGVSQSAITFTVRLLGGSVLITAASSELNGWKKDKFLLAGNEMKYSVKAMSVAVSRFNTLVRPLPGVYRNEIVNRNKGALIFSNTALADVPRKLDAAITFSHSL